MKPPAPRDPDGFPAVWSPSSLDRLMADPAEAVIRAVLGLRPRHIHDRVMLAGTIYNQARHWTDVTSQTRFVAPDEIRDFVYAAGVAADFEAATIAPSMRNPRAITLDNIAKAAISAAESYPPPQLTTFDHPDKGSTPSVEVPMWMAVESDVLRRPMWLHCIFDAVERIGSGFVFVERKLTFRRIDEDHVNLRFNSTQARIQQMLAGHWAGEHPAMQRFELAALSTGKPPDVRMPERPILHDSAWENTCVAWLATIQFWWDAGFFTREALIAGRIPFSPGGAARYITAPSAAATIQFLSARSAEDREQILDEMFEQADTHSPADNWGWFE